MKRRPPWMKILIIVLVLDAVLIVVGLGLRRYMRVAAPADDMRLRMRELERSLDLYYADCKSFPTVEQGLGALLDSPKAEPLCETWDGPYADENLLKDQWGNFYLYGREDVFFSLKTLGEDGRPGGEGTGADIALEDL